MVVDHSQISRLEPKVYCWKYVTSVSVVSTNRVTTILVSGFEHKLIRRVGLGTSATLVFKEVQNRPNTPGTQPMRWVCDVERFFMSPQFGPEFTLAHEMELLGQSLIGVLEHLDLGSVQVMAGRQCGSCTGSESK